jgi:hypothetical protein
MAITDWPEDERPREKLLAHGAESLSDAELLALFLRVGVKGKRPPIVRYDRVFCRNKNHTKQKEAA